MKTMIGDNPTTLDLKPQHPTEVAMMEVFLDLDPVFPGWPPGKGLADPAHEAPKDDPQWRAS